MNGNEVLRIVDAIHRDKNIDKEIVFEGIEQAILSAARKHFGDEEELTVDIDRLSGQPTVKHYGKDLEPDVLGDILGRIAAQTAKQVMIQKIREAERDALFEEYSAMKGLIVSGTINRSDGGAATVNLGKVEGLLPRSEQIPGETHRAGERVRAVIMDVRKVGSRVRIILSRTHADFVRQLFELEIPEVSEHIIEVRSLSREAGYRSKVAVSCIDSKIDAVGACVGVRGSRIKNIVDELAGERIDIVRWNDSLQVLVPNALQPAEVDDVILCPMLGRVIVLVRDDQLSLAIGKRGQNVRLASKLVGWDIEVMTREELDDQLDKSVEAFSSVPGVNEDLAESLVAQGFFSFYDLSVIEPDQLADLGDLTPEQCDVIVEHADVESERQEREEDEQRRLRATQAAAETKEAAAETKETEQPAASAAETTQTAETTQEQAQEEQAQAATASAGEAETEESQTEQEQQPAEETETAPEQQEQEQQDQEEQQDQTAEATAASPSQEEAASEEESEEDEEATAEPAETAHSSSSDDEQENTSPGEQQAGTENENEEIKAQQPKSSPKDEQNSQNGGETNRTDKPGEELSKAEAD